MSVNPKTNILEEIPHRDQETSNTMDKNRQFRCRGLAYPFPQKEEQV